MTATSRRPAAPKDLARRGAQFWRDVVKVYELNVDERQLLVEACRTLDLCDRLRERVDLDGEMIRGSTGQERLHPAIGELRQARALLAKLLAQLDLPDPHATPRSRRNSSRAAKAAESRWRQEAHREDRRHGATS